MTNSDQNETWWNENWWISEKSPNKKQTREEKLREMHPGLKDAWEQYQVMLRMVEGTLPEDKTAAEILDGIRARIANTGKMKK